MASRPVATRYLPLIQNEGMLFGIELDLNKGKIVI
jgi:hypothetical protein